MIAFNLVAVALALLTQTEFVVARPANATLAANTVPGDGVTPKSGRINANLQWQSATGGLVSGPCPGSTAHPISITDCYQISLSADPTKNLDQGHLDSPRQRVEFLTPALAGGKSFSYHWKMYLSSTTGTGSSFFHLMQIISRSDGGPIIMLSAVNNKVAIKDTKRPNASVPSIALSAFTDRTTVHSIRGTYGDSGSVDYRITDTNGTQILRYKATGAMGSNASVKFGMYRKAYAGMTAVKAAVGDFGLGKL